MQPRPAQGWTDADAGLLEQLEAVERVDGPALLLGRRLRLFWHLDPREEVERALCRVARHPVELVERVAEDLAPLLELGGDGFRLLLPQVVRRLPLLRRLDEHVDADLALQRGAELDRGQLVDLLGDLWIEVEQLEVAPSPAALARLALGDGVEADELDLGRVRLAQVVDDLAERDKGPFAGVVDVGLVDLVGHEDEAGLVAELDDRLHRLPRQAVADRVAGRDDDHGLWQDPGRAGGSEDVL